MSATADETEPIGIDMNDRGIKDEMFFRIFQVYFYLIPPQVNGNKQINER